MIHEKIEKMLRIRQSGSSDPSGFSVKHLLDDVFEECIICRRDPKMRISPNSIHNFCVVSGLIDLRGKTTDLGVEFIEEHRMKSHV